MQNFSKMIQVIGVAGIVCLSLAPLSASEKEEEYRKLLSSKGDKQKVAISGLKEAGLHNLLPQVSEILRKDDVDAETIARIVDLYESYGEDLDSYLPRSVEDYEYVIQHAQSDALVVQILEILLLKKDKRFMYGVIELLTHRSSEVRQVVYKYLDGFKDDRILPYILELGNSESAIERYYYLEALNYINDERATVHVSKLLNDPSPAIRSEAIVVVGRLGIKEKEAQVLNMAKADSNYEVRKYGVQYASSKNLRHRSDIFKKALLDSHSEVREVSLLAVQRFKDSSYANTISYALELENLSFLRSMMLDTLISVRNHGGGRGLIATLQKEESAEVRKKAAYATGVLSARMVVPALIANLSSEQDVLVKIEVARTLGVLKEKSAVPMLLTKLKQSSENLDFRHQMLSSLDQIDDPRVMPVIFDMIEEESTDFRKDMKEFLRNMLYRYHGGGGKSNSIVRS
jgi:HEAT repeat protein